MRSFLTVLASCLLLMNISSSCSVAEQEEDFTFSIYDESGSDLKSLEVDVEGHKQIPVSVFAGAEWTLSVTDGSEWIAASRTSGPKGPCLLYIDAASNKGADERAGCIKFYCKDLTVSISVRQKGRGVIIDTPVADLLDVVFNSDGTASDISKSAMTVNYLKGGPAVCYYNGTYGRYVSHYNHKLASTVSAGYYEIDYTDNLEFQNALEDGHTLEVVFRMDLEANGSEIKPFSSMDSGGLGFLITASSRGKEITYLPNVSTDGKSNWIWAQSGIVPEPGRYYHVVGVWNKKTQRASVYVDGVFKNEVDAIGELNLPGTQRKWFCIGGDPGGGKAQCTFNGDVAIARIYDKPLVAEEVALLYENAVNDATTEVIKVSDITYLPFASVAKEYWYYVYADGFRSGDVLTLESTQNSSISYRCRTECVDGMLKLQVPDELMSGNYRIMLGRGDSILPLGYVDLKMTDAIHATRKTRIVAHRGYHPGNIPENSIASLIEAQKLKVYGSELDVYITTDGVVVLYHDTTLKGASDHADNESYKGLRPDSCTYEEIRNYKLSNGELIPTLDQYLDQAKKCPEVKVILEIKSHDTAEKNMRAVKACYEVVMNKGMQSQVEYISGNYDILKKVVEYDPDAMVQVLGSRSDVEMYLKDGIRGIDYRHDRLTDDIIHQARELGMTINVWTLNTVDAMMEFIGKGVDLITTDEAELGMSVVGKTYVDSGAFM